MNLYIYHKIYLYFQNSNSKLLLNYKISQTSNILIFFIIIIGREIRNRRKKLIEEEESVIM